MVGPTHRASTRRSWIIGFVLPLSVHDTSLDISMHVMCAVLILGVLSVYLVAGCGPRCVKSARSVSVSGNVDVGFGFVVSIR